MSALPAEYRDPGDAQRRGAGHGVSRDTVAGVNDDPSVLLLIAAAALVIALIVLVWWAAATESAVVTGRFDRPAAVDPAGGAATAQGRPERSAFGRRREQPSRRAGVVINPSKFDSVGPVKRRVEEMCRRAGWDDPLWIETTVEEPGTAQARQAVAAGCDVVCALGGDGTVRNVAAGLVDTGIPMGLLPAGTGNLLARNLSIPIDHLADAMRVALGGRNTRIDTCELTLTRPREVDVHRSEDEGKGIVAGAAEDGPTSYAPPAGEDPEARSETHLYLVMAGLGFDAEVMADVEDGLKSRMGWAAYLVAGVQHLRGSRFRVDVKTDDGWQARRRVRSVLVGNVGKLQGGLVLLPDAKFDDGVLDVLLLAPEGMVGWGAVAARVLTRQRKGHHRVDHRHCHRIEVRANKPVAIQLDGDSMGSATAMTVQVRPSSLVVRRPITSLTGR